MGKYRKKPVVIDAVRFNPESIPWPEGVKSWHGQPQPRDGSCGYIQTLEGKMHVMGGDWIVTGVAGEKYAVKDDIFRKTYEPVSAEEQ